MSAKEFRPGMLTHYLVERRRCGFSKSIDVSRPDLGLVDYYPEYIVGKQHDEWDGFYIGRVKLIDYAFELIFLPGCYWTDRFVFSLTNFSEILPPNKGPKPSWIENNFVTILDVHGVTEVIKEIDRLLLLGRYVTADVFLVYEHFLKNACFCDSNSFLKMKLSKLDNYRNRIRYGLTSNVVGMEKILSVIPDSGYNQ